MILTKDEILKEINSKNIAITPFNEDNIGAASYDVTLADTFRIFKKFEVDVNEDTDYKKITKKIKSEFYELKPGEFVLGLTEEKIKLPGNICGFITGRSRFARLGLMVHITACFIQPGVNNKQVLEIRNVGNCNLKLYPGTKVGQIIFEHCDGACKYKGKFKNQKSL